ncbi:gamma-glutamyl phosphate reductase [Striga asiatica]|uniref:Gamma-glutamyl phosphate reductase n=1 Tax=Striga asiatica TaxID=4170 RepID=A0A5A7RCC7_STRAF|nr:gamma-glutamyl phosphate reductase [Striga asiatica]
MAYLSSSSSNFTRLGYFLVLQTLSSLAPILHEALEGDPDEVAHMKEKVESNERDRLADGPSYGKGAELRAKGAKLQAKGAELAAKDSKPSRLKASVDERVERAREEGRTSFLSSIPRVCFVKQYWLELMSCFKHSNELDLRSTQPSLQAEREKRIFVLCSYALLA